MVDLLYTIHNRFEFTEASLTCLLDNTDSSLISNFQIYCDNCSGFPSLDIMRRARAFGGKAEIHETSFGSIVKIMQDFLPRGSAPFIAKIDNDTMVPPGWLNDCLQTLDVFKRVDLLGIEAHNAMHSLEVSGSTNYLPRYVKLTEYIGGIGLFRRPALSTLSTAQPRGAYYGFTEWQCQHPEIVKAWLSPALPVFLLDHLPREPWTTLSAEYVRRGWQRETWSLYPESRNELWKWWCE